MRRNNRVGPHAVTLANIAWDQWAGGFARLAVCRACRYRILMENGGDCGPMPGSM
ncbi:hypothetical protein REMIM1_CH00515 [Rhizobium etli bv. mimosae str. Mim1]|nr:hypothetical protein REMIM1_CH00515 [Rhizobium etli bv. mimosae str. Mim1]